MNTACQLVAVIMQIQSQFQFGGVSATHIDWTMVPYIRKSFWRHYCDGMKYFGEGKFPPVNKEHRTEVSINDERYTQNERCHQYAIDMTEREIHQAVEALYHNLNTLMSRPGNQVPFSSINYGTCTETEGRMFTQALLEVSIEGIGINHKTSIFPCGIFQLKKGVNREPGDPNYDLYRLALKSTSTRLYPNYVNCDWSNNAGYDPEDPKTWMSTMGCRTSNGFDINGLGQLKDGRGNICPVTIVLPTIAKQALDEFNNLPWGGSEGDLFEMFMERLDHMIFEAKDMLLERFYWIAKQSPDSAKFMYENGTMEGYVPEEGIISALKHGTIVIGQLGLAECLQCLFGYDHTDKRGMEYAKQIEALFNKRCAEFKKEYSLNFGVYYTPNPVGASTAMWNEKIG